CDAATHLLEGAWHERGRPAQGEFGAQFGQRPDIGSGDAAIENVAQDRHLEPFDAPFSLAYREGIQQCLSGMLVCAITSVDDAGVEHAREKMRSPRGAVADDN